VKKLWKFLKRGCAKHCPSLTIPEKYPKISENIRKSSIFCEKAREISEKGLCEALSLLNYTRKNIRKYPKILYNFGKKLWKFLKRGCAKHCPSLTIPEKYPKISENPLYFVKKRGKFRKRGCAKHCPSLTILEKISENIRKYPKILYNFGKKHGKFRKRGCAKHCPSLTILEKISEN